jgi:class 3 adenylate cyclase
MKIFSSFRAKLILSLFPIIVGVTAGTLWLVERRFAETYQRLFEDQFENQIRFVTQAKERRFEALANVLERISQKPEIVQAVQQQDYSSAGQLLRPELEKLAAERLINERQPQPNKRANGDRAEPRMLDAPGAPFIALLDAEGEFVLNSRLKANTAAQNSPEAQRRRSQRMPWFGKESLSSKLQQQEVGYLWIEGDERRPEQITEILITPIKNGSQFLGALVFGLPMSHLADRALYQQTKKSEFGEIMSGFYVEDQFLSTTVPEKEQPIVAKALARALEKFTADRKQIPITIQGEKHRLIYRVLNPESPFPHGVQVNLYSMKPLELEISEMRQSGIALGLLALGMGLGLTYLVSRGLSGPVNQLIRAAQNIEKGHFDTRLPARRDELGRVAQAFNQMAAGLAMQEKYRSILHAVADRSVAEQLLNHENSLGGELRTVTMLFCDIRGFTSLTETMPPAAVIEMLNEHMTALTEVAYHYGGTVDKFVGDMIMVLFGAPFTGPADAHNAVLCAQEMLRRRQLMNATTTQQQLEIGIGITTGQVLAGCMGSEQRLNYTVLGQRVNLAARLCSAAQAHEILIDDETLQQLPPDLTTETLPDTQLKGFTEVFAIHRVIH